MEPAAVRLVLVEGENADGLTVEEDSFPVEVGGAAAQVIAALVGTREGAADNGHQLTSAGVTWTDPAAAAALRRQLAMRDAGSVMLVSPLLAAAALAQTVGSALDYPHIAMLFVEADSATLAIVDVADGSIVDLHRQSLGRGGPDMSAEVAAMIADLDAPASRAAGVFVVGCGVDIVAMKPALEAATSLVVSFPEEPHLALARGAALASANAPLFASSTAALAYALDPGTGEVNSKALTQTYLDVCANADLGDEALAYSAWSDTEDDGADGPGARPHRPLALAGGALAGIAAMVAGLLVVSLTSDVRPAALTEPDPPASVVTPVTQLPVQVTAEPPLAQLPVPSTAPATPAPSAAPVPVTEVAAPPTVLQPPRVVQKAPPTVANAVPAPRRQPTQQAPPPVQTPVQQAVPPPTPAAPPAPPEPAAPPPPPTPIATMYLHVPFATIPIPIYPPAPPAPPPPPEPAPAEPGPLAEPGP